MIQYTTGHWNLRLLFIMEGSVFPKSLVWSIPAAIHSALFQYLWFDVWHHNALQRPSAFGAVWSSFAFVLGFLIVFRTQQAHSRYWEGATSIQQARVNFFNAFSSVIAFCAEGAELRHRVEEFQHLLARLMSMLHCVALQTVVAEQDNGKFEFFNTNGINGRSMRFLTSHSDFSRRSEILLQWIQKLVVNGSRDGTIDVPPPILARFFQELSGGVVQVVNARNMTAIPFPFPYAQLLTMLLFAFWLVSPVFYALLLGDPMMSASFSFFTTFAFWGTNYIAAELESPFGDDPNDLPLYALQKDMNKSLWVLLDPMAQSAPKFEFDKVSHRQWNVIREHPEEHHSRESANGALASNTTNKTWMQARGSGLISQGLRRLSTRVSRLTHSSYSSSPTERSSRADSTMASRMTHASQSSSPPERSSKAGIGNKVLILEEDGIVSEPACRGLRQHADRSVDHREEEQATAARAISAAEVSLEDCVVSPVKQNGALVSTEVSLDDFDDGLPGVARHVNDYMHQLRVSLKSLIEHTIRDLQLLQTRVEWTGAHGPSDLDRLLETNAQQAQPQFHSPPSRAVSFQRSSSASQHHT